MAAYRKYQRQRISVAWHQRRKAYNGGRAMAAKMKISGENQKISKCQHKIAAQAMAASAMRRNEMAAALWRWRRRRRSEMAKIISARGGINHRRNGGRNTAKIWRGVIEIENSVSSAWRAAAENGVQKMQWRRRKSSANNERKQPSANVAQNQRRASCWHRMARNAGGIARHRRRGGGVSALSWQLK
jgi:hypothetical protein